MRCNFERLCSYLNDELDESLRHEVLVHIRQCDICLEAVMLMSAERDAECLESDSPGRRTGQRGNLGKGAFTREPSGLQSPFRHAYQGIVEKIPAAGSVARERLLR